MENGTSGTQNNGNGTVGGAKGGAAAGLDGNKSGAANVDGGPGNAAAGTAGQQSGGVVDREPGSEINGTLGNGSGVPPTAKKRGRPPGSPNGTTPANKKNLAVNTTDAPKKLARTVAGFHAMAAKFTKIKLFELEPAEANDIANAVIEVAAEYNIVISKRVAVWSNLFGVAAAVYGPRIALIVMLKQQNKAPQRTADVVPLTTATANTGNPPPQGKMRYEG